MGARRADAIPARPCSPPFGSRAVSLTRARNRAVTDSILGRNDFLRPLLMGLPHGRDDTHGSVGDRIGLAPVAPADAPAGRRTHHGSFGESCRPLTAGLPRPVGGGLEQLSQFV